MVLKSKDDITPQVNQLEELLRLRLSARQVELIEQVLSGIVVSPKSAFCSRTNRPARSYSRNGKMRMELPSLPFLVVAITLPAASNVFWVSMPLIRLAE
jgi:hypothetical protein